MKDFQGRKRWHKVLRSDIFAYILLVLTLILIRSVWDAYKKESLASMNTENDRQTLERLNNKKDVLEKAVAKMSTERGVEEELRRRFQVARPGEQLLVIVDKDENPLPENSSQGDSLWQKVVGLIYFWK